MSLSAASKKNKGKEIMPENVPEFEPLENENDSEDVDYEPNEEDSDAENSQVEEMRKYADPFKRELKTKRLGVPVEEEADFVIPEDANILDDGASSSEEGDWSYDEVSDGEGGTSFVKRKSRWPRFDNTREEPKFPLGMTFNSRDDFKVACKRYGLATYRHITFDKDEATKIRAKCSWPTCKWSCYASKSSRSSWFQM